MYSKKKKIATKFRNEKIYFIGAGPGDPELLTIKGKRILGISDMVIYAGSLIDRHILKFGKKDALFYDSSGMALEEVIDVFKEGKSSKKIVSRLHSGDPSIYGAIQEETDWCKKEGIPYEIIPGVSSLFAAAASLKRELTLPGITQTVIITMMTGRTDVPEKEELSRLAKINATLAIFLSIDKINDIVKSLLSGYDKSTPAVCVFRATWPDEKIIKGTLEDIAPKVKKEKIKRQALILVGKALGEESYEKSKLYSSAFSHSFRIAKNL